MYIMQVYVPFVDTCTNSPRLKNYDLESIHQQIQMYVSKHINKISLTSPLFIEAQETSRRIQFYIELSSVQSTRVFTKRFRIPRLSATTLITKPLSQRGNNASLKFLLASLIFYTEKGLPRQVLMKRVPRQDF